MPEHGEGIMEKKAKEVDPMEENKANQPGLFHTMAPINIKMVFMDSPVFIYFVFNLVL